MGAVQQSGSAAASRLDDCRHVIGLHPHFGFWSARLPENHRFLSRTAMPIDDPELPLRFEPCCDGARQAELIRDAVEGVGKEHIIDRLRHDRIEHHGVGHDELAVGHARRSNAYPRLIQHGRVDVDGVDVISQLGRAEP